MAGPGKSLAHKTFPWRQSGFDLEGVVGFLLGWLLALLLGTIWSPLFWLAFVPGVMFLFATRTAERVTPDDPDVMVAPCDGVVVSIEEVDPPEEIKFAESSHRIRISTSPFSANNIHAPVGGLIDAIFEKEGEAKAVAALNPDDEDLSQLFMTLAGEHSRVGIKVITGGLGPRLDVKSDAGDRVTAGKTIAIRRLGGWCDVFVPSDAAGSILVEPGRTLIGGETFLWSIVSSASESLNAPDDTADSDPVAVSPAPEVIPAEVVEEDVPEAPLLPSKTDATDPVSPETVPPTIAEEAPKEPRSGDEETASVFARLRREARKLSGDPQKD
ncbi:phosphatidylserine decarboxylase [Henriciella litoralis]|uniref:phosphatidylserine decarboxylase n=1 Tax=Henriciella litoralis TaxID=568102 RepID=UPI000A042502|nr:phosphatidylserine decarboxylase [Henriciella litoralis]